MATVKQLQEWLANKDPEADVLVDVISEGLIVNTTLWPETPTGMNDVMIMVTKD